MWRKRAMRTVLAGGVAAALWLLNVAFMPMDSTPYVPPSELYYNRAWAIRYRRYRTTPHVDLLILGNSRAANGLDPEIIERETGLVTRSLAAGGGFFPFYEAVLTEMIPDHLPRTVLLGLSPRDLRDHTFRMERPKAALMNSPAFQMKTPYAEPFNTIEKRLGDLYALVLPALYHRTEFVARLKRRDLSGLAELCPRIRAYFARFKAAARWWSGALPVEPDRVETRPPGDRRQAYESIFRTYRDRALDANAPKIWAGADAPGDSLVRWLADEGVDVIIIVPPAVMMEGWENNRTFYRQFRRRLDDWADTYGNVRSVIDMNNNFDHPYLDWGLYIDLEHLTPEGASIVSSDLARRIKALSTGPSAPVGRKTGTREPPASSGTQR